MLDQAFMREHLQAFLSRVFALQEVECVVIRGVRIDRGTALLSAAAKAVERSYHDCLSDVDLHVQVSLPPECTAEAYMAHMERYGIDEQSCLGFQVDRAGRVLRAVFRNGVRYDVMFEFDTVPDAPRMELAMSTAEKDAQTWPMENVNRFWFVQIQALGKLYRRDYLISSHLANMGLNETLVQQMVLRDMKYGTNHHRYGYSEELAYQRFQGECPIRTGDARFDLIADKIHCAAKTYDAMMQELCPGHSGRYQDFIRIWRMYAESLPALPV